MEFITFFLLLHYLGLVLTLAVPTENEARHIFQGGYFGGILAARDTALPLKLLWIVYNNILRVECTDKFPKIDIAI